MSPQYTTATLKKRLFRDNGKRDRAKHWGIPFWEILQKKIGS